MRDSKASKCFFSVSFPFLSLSPLLFSSFSSSTFYILNFSPHCHFLLSLLLFLLVLNYPTGNASSVIEQERGKDEEDEEDDDDDDDEQGDEKKLKQV